MRAATAVLAVGLVLAPLAAVPCDCVSTPKRDAKSAYKKAKYVLLGRVTEATFGSSKVTFLLEPVRTWKGKLKVLRAQTYGGGSSCALSLEHGKFYVVFADNDPQQIEICGNEPIPLAAAKDTILFLDEERGFAPLPPEVLATPTAN
jgi:hypothetical protein